MSGYLGNGPQVGRWAVNVFLATAGQTSFSGIDSNGYTLQYTKGFVEVMVNGIYLLPSEYTATDGSSVVISRALNTNDTVAVRSMTTYAPADVISQSQSGADINNKTTFRSYLPDPGSIFGLTLSTAGSSTTLSVAAGFA